MDSSTPIAREEWFVSYSSVDRAVVVEIVQRLTAQGIQTFFDRHNLRPGLPWFDELEDALRRARGAIVFLSPTGLGRIQKRELQFALAHQADVEGAGAPPFRVISVLLPGSDRTQLPGFAALNTWLEISGPADLDGLLRAVSEPISDPTSGIGRSRISSCPYRGLNAFREEDSPLYFGREQQSAKLLELVRHHRFVGVIGSSGTGKSSLVQAGLLPKLRLERPPSPTWEVVTFNPGKRPFYNAVSSLSRLWRSEGATVAEFVAEADDIERKLLAHQTRLVSYLHEGLARLSNADRLLVVIDQLEELFTQSHDDGVRRHVIESILEFIDEPACSVVMTLRADYYGRVIELSADLSARLEQAQANLGPMNRDSLRAVVVGPSTRAGITFEEGLVDRVLDDVERQPGSLPLLEFTLTELWATVPDGAFTHRDYERVGKVSGAISNRAEAVLRRLTPAQRQRAPAVLTRLVSVTSTSDEGADSRQIVRLDELDAESRAILDEFARARLVVVGGEDGRVPTAEVAHEALIRSWQSLRGWIDEDVQFLRWRQRLEIFIGEWNRAARSPSLLLSGPLLEEARPWLRSHGKSLSATEREFIRMSMRRQAGSNTLRWAAAVLVVLMVAAAAGYGWWIRSDNYQIDFVIHEAPLRAALFSSHNEDEPFVETVFEWFRGLTLVRGQEEAKRSLRQGDPLQFCAEATIATTARALRGSVADSRVMEVERVLSNPIDTESLRCVPLLTLTDDERRRVIEAVARLHGEVDKTEPGSSYSEYYKRIEAAIALLALGDTERARARAGEALAMIASGAEQGRSQLLAHLAKHLGGLLSDAEQKALLSAVKVEGESDYYLRKARISFASRDVALDAVDRFLQEETKEGPYSPQDIAEEAGRIIAREIRKGNTHPDAIDQVLNRLTSISSEGPFRDRLIAAALLPLPEAFLDAGQVEAASDTAERLLTNADEIPNEDERSRALAVVARVFARLGQLARARSIADRCQLSLDKLRGYAAILGASPAARAQVTRTP